MATIVRPNIFALHKELEKRLGRDVPISEVSERTGLSRNTLDALMKPDKAGRGIMYETMGALLDYFAAHGMAISLGDFFAIEEGKEEGSGEG